MHSSAQPARLTCIVSQWHAVNKALNRSSSSLDLAPKSPQQAVQEQVSMFLPSRKALCRLVPHLLQRVVQHRQP